MPDPSLIDTIVIVMMENRSFDNMLGHLSCQGYDNRKEVEGLRYPLKDERYENIFEGESYYPFSMKDIMLPSDLPHERDEINVQLAHSSVSGTYTMSGFVGAYYQYTAVNRTQRPEPMGYYPPDQVPITNFLANNFAVCDHWFSSLPTSTVPNRLMALSGESRVDKTGRQLFPEEGYIVLDWLNDHGIRWRVYHAGLSFFMLLGRFTDVLGPNFRSVKHLAIDVKVERPDQFPQVIFIEPSYYDARHFGTDQPNDNHPPLAVGFGEDFIRRIYKALTSNPERWRNTVMILTYDEHGGFFDHVPPLPITYNPPGGEYAPFESTGVRVPAIIVSPFVASHAVYKGLLDHTSILQFLAERFAPRGEGYSKSVNERRNYGIRSVSQVLDLDTPRTDIPPVPSNKIQRVTILGLEEVEMPQGLMQTAFENAASKMIDAWPEQTKQKFPDIYHWSLTKSS
ncbi:MAG: alkaline phosphatase family protein [Thermodesulfobacteriota bacterium]